MKRFTNFLIFSIFLIPSLYGQNKKKYNLGNGVVVLNYNANPNTQLYKDSACKIPYLKLTEQNTNCPTCHGCAEPTRYYKGPIHPFICNLLTGIVFIGGNYGNKKHWIYTNTSGSISYILPNNHLQYMSWSTYFSQRGKEGDYFQFNRQWDSTIIYNKKYPTTHLPKPNRQLLVNLTIKNLDEVNFYPLLVDGFWMKIRGVRNGRFIGNFWIIWRTETDWLVGFKFDPN